jgi:hypothetical protein
MAVPLSKGPLIAYGIKVQMARTLLASASEPRLLGDIVVIAGAVAILRKLRFLQFTGGGFSGCCLPWL